MTDSNSYYKMGTYEFAFEGAAQGFKLEQRNLYTKPAEQIAAEELKFLQNRSEYLTRNDGWGASSLLNYRKHMQGLSVRWKDTKGNTHADVQALWDDFADDPSIDGYGNFINIQDIWKLERYVKGTAISRFIIKRRSSGGVPLYLQQIDARLLDPSYMGKELSDNIRNSIKFDDFNRPISYYFSNLNKNDNSFSLEKTIIPAQDIIHIFERQSANDWVGFPALSSVISALYDVSDLTDATIAKQQAAQAIAWVITNSNPSSVSAVGSATKKVNKEGKKQTITTANGGGTFYLEKGENLNFFQGTDIGPNLQELMRFELHKIAKTVGLTYETLTGDLTGLSFSAIKAIIIELKHSIEFAQNLYYVNLGVLKVCKRFKELALLKGPKNWQKLQPKVEFPKFYGVDDLKDTQTDVLELMSGLGDIETKLSERNISKDSVERTLDFLRKNGLLQDKTFLANNNTQSKNINPNPNSSG